MFKLRNKTASNFLLADRYLSQPFAANEVIDLEELFSYEQLHKSTYYGDGGIRAALLAANLELLDQDDLLEAAWRFSAPQVEYVTVGETQVAEKKIDLRLAPRKGLVALDVLGGLAQFPGLDFVVTDKTISWDARGLESLLEAGDTLRIVYGS